MAIIPDYDQKSGLMPSAPELVDVQPGRFGRDAEALTRFGGEIGELGSKLMVARKKAEDHDSSSNSFSETSRWWTDTVLSAQKEFGKLNSNGTYDITNDRGYADRLDKLAKEHANEKIKSLPSGDAQRMYLEKANSLFTSGYTSNSIYENTTIARNAKLNIQTRNRQTILEMIVDRGPVSLHEALEKISSEYLAGSNNENGAVPLFSPDDGRDFLRKDGNDAIYAYFQERDPETGLKELNSLRTLIGKDKIENVDDNILNPARYARFDKGLDFGGSAGWISDFIDQNDFRIIKDRLEQRLNNHNRSAIGEAVEKLRKVGEFLVSPDATGDYTNELMGAYAVLDKAVDNGQYDRYRLDDQIMDLSVKNHIHKVIKKSMNDKIGMSDSYLNELESVADVAAADLNYTGEGKNVFKRGFIDRAKNYISEFVEKRDKMFLEYPIEMGQKAGWGSKKSVLHDLAARTKFGDSDNTALNEQFFAAARAYQINVKGFHPDQVKLLTESKASAVVKELTTLSPELAGKAFHRYSEIWGEYMDENVSQLSSMKNGLPEGYESALNLGGPGSAETAINRLRNPKVAGDLLKSMDKGDDAESIDKETGTIVSKYFTQLGVVGNVSKNSKMILGITKDIANDAKLRLAANPGMTYEKAISDSIEHEIKPKFYVINETLVPKSIGNVQIKYPWAIKAEMDYKVSDKFLAENVNMKPIYARSLVSGAYRWLPDERLKTARLQAVNPLVKHRDPYIDVTDKKGNLIIIDFKEHGKDGKTTDASFIDRNFTGEID